MGAVVRRDRVISVRLDDNIWRCIVCVPIIAASDACIGDKSVDAGDLADGGIHAKSGILEPPDVCRNENVFNGGADTSYVATDNEITARPCLSCQRRADTGAARASNQDNSRPHTCPPVRLAAAVNN
jgi:hypothetical protein